MRSTKVLAASLLLFFFGVTALAQPPGQIDKDRERQRLRLRALSIVEQTADEAPLWNDKKAAVHVLAEAADLLWGETPGQGAKWLTKAWALIEQVSDSPREEKLKEFFTNSDQTDLRTAVLTVALKQDPGLADKFLKQLSQKEPNEEKERGAFDDRTARSEQLLSLAQQAIDANPQLAFNLAEKSLADGISYTLQNILTSLRRKDVQLANRLFDLALARLSSTLPEPSEAHILAGYLFQPGFTFSANSGGQTMLVMNPDQQNFIVVGSSEPQQARRFLTVVYERLLTQPIALETRDGKQRAQQILVLGHVIARRYPAFAPELAQSALGFLAQLQRQLMPEGHSGSSNGTSRTTSDSGDSTKSLTKEENYETRISELEDSAEKESNAMFRNVAYIQAALATKPEDYDRAERIAQKIDNNDLRTDATSFVVYRAALFFVEKAQIEKAIDLTPTISDVLRRAVVKIAIAQRLQSSKSETVEPGEANFAQQRVLDLLNDMDRDIKKEPSANAARILLGETAVLGKLDKDQALALLEQAVNMINKLERFDLRDGAAPNLGMGAFSASGATVTRPRASFDFRSAIDPLILENFEQVSAIAQRLTTKELSGVARLDAAKLYLSKIGYSTAKQSTLVR